MKIDLTQFEETGFVNQPELAKILGLPRTTVRRLSMEGSMPPFLKLAPKAHVFKTEDIKEWSRKVQLEQ